MIVLQSPLEICSPVSIYNGQMRDASDSGETLQEHVKMPRLRRNAREFSRKDGSDNRPFDKTSKNSISRFWFLVTRRKRCYFELIIVRAERAYQESGVYISISA